MTIIASNALFHEAKRIVPGWDTLNSTMVSRYIEWRMFSESRWDDVYVVKVSIVVLNKRPVQRQFKFEDRAHAVKCQQWWNEMRMVSEIHLIE